MTIVVNEHMKQEEVEPENDFEVAKSFADHQNRRTLVFCIPSKLAQRYNLKKPCKLLLIPQKDGILLKKMELTK